jgi:hypothetical protein
VAEYLFPWGFSFKKIFIPQTGLIFLALQELKNSTIS